MNYFFRCIITMTALLFCMSFLFTSCTKTKYPKEIEYLDSVQTQLNTLEKELKSFDTLKVKSYLDEQTSDLNYIQRMYKDTMTNDLAIFLSDYRSLRKPMLVFRDKNKELIKEVEYSNEQIQNLIHDLKKNKLEKDKMIEYFAVETAVADQVIQSTKITTEAIKKYEEMNPKIQQIVKELKSKERKK